MGKWGRFVVGLIFPAPFLEQEHSDTDPHHWWVQRAEKKGKIFTFGGPVLEQRSQTGSQGKSREGFCGFPACPTEFAMPWGLGELLRAQDHIPALLCSTSAPCSVLIFAGSWRLKSP